MNVPATSGLILTLVLHGGVAAGLVAFSSWTEDDNARPALNMVTIEASLAYKSTEPTDQPQKTRKRRKRRRKPKAVSRDATKKVKPEKKAEEPPEEPAEDFTDDFKKYMEMRQSEEDEEVEAEEPKPGGQFNGSERGFAEVSKGDPYMQDLAADVFDNWSVPTLEKSAGAAVGCVRLDADGSIVDVKLWQPTENANIDRSVRLALEKLQEQREPGESPVPQHLMDATNRWTCFNFSVTGQ